MADHVSSGDSKLNQLAVIIPVYNEADSIKSVVSGIRLHLPKALILVVDDGSTDNSVNIARSVGVSVLELPFNLGIGGAVQTGYLLTVEQGFQIVARIDGDCQHDPAQLTDIIQPIVLEKADVVIGSRFLENSTYQPSFARKIGISIFAKAVSFIVGQQFTDTTSGFQALNHQAVDFLSKHLPSDYPEIEGLVMLCRAGFHVVEVPVRMGPRKSGQSSISPLRSVYYAVKVLLAVFIEMLRRPLKKEI